MWGIAQEFTTHRWRSNPFQMFSTLFLGTWSLLGIIRGATEGGVLATQVDHHAQVILAATNLFGAIICLFSLHMRDLESALWVEVVGYVSLVGSLGIYLYLVTEKTGNLFNSAPGVGLSWAFMAASLFRTVQIFRLKKAERRARELRRLVARVDPDGDVVDVEGSDV
jgi:hypothetical protein